MFLCRFYAADCRSLHTEAIHAIFMLLWFLVLDYNLFICLESFDLHSKPSITGRIKLRNTIRYEYMYTLKIRLEELAAPYVSRPQIHVDS